MKFIFFILILLHHLQFAKAQSKDTFVTQIKFESNYPLSANTIKYNRPFYGIVTFTKDSITFFDYNLHKTIAIKDISNLSLKRLRTNAAETFWYILGSVSFGLPITSIVGNETNASIFTTVLIGIASILTLGYTIDLLFQNQKNYLEIETTQETFQVFSGTKSKKIIKKYKKLNIKN